MINTRASQNFIKVDEAKHLSFKYEKTNSWLKTVNSEAKTLSGVTRDVELHIST